MLAKLEGKSLAQNCLNIDKMVSLFEHIFMKSEKTFRKLLKMFEEFERSDHNHSEAQIVNFRRWSSIPDVHLYPKNRPKNSHSSSLEYYNTYIGQNLLNCIAQCFQTKSVLSSNKSSQSPNKSPLSCFLNRRITSLEPMRADGSARIVARKVILLSRK